jgi:hypothetical protein
MGADFWGWTANLLGTAFINPDSWLSILIWIVGLLDIAAFAISKWGLPKVKEIAKTISSQILRFAAPITLLIVFVCIINAVYCSPLRQAGH